MLIISNIFFVIVLALATGYLTFLTTKGNLIDNRFKNYWYRLTKRGKLVFFLLIIIGLTLIWQELNIQRKNSQGENILKIEQNKRDSIITKSVDSSRQKLFDDISKAFLKQELRLDTVRKDVDRIRDSAKEITNNYVQTDEPVLLIDSNGIKLLSQNNFQRRYLIGFKSSDAASTTFQIECYLVTPINQNQFDVLKGNIFPSDLQIPKNGKWETDFTIEIEPLPKELYFNLIGTYTNLGHTKTYKVNNVYVFDVETNSVNTLMGPDRQKILSVIKNNKSKKINFKRD